VPHAEPGIEARSGGKAARPPAGALHRQSPERTLELLSRMTGKKTLKRSNGWPSRSLGPILSSWRRSSTSPEGGRSPESKREGTTEEVEWVESGHYHVDLINADVSLNEVLAVMRAGQEEGCPAPYERRVRRGQDRVRQVSRAGARGASAPAASERPPSLEAWNVREAYPSGVRGGCSRRRGAAP